MLIKERKPVKTFAIGAKHKLLARIMEGLLYQTRQEAANGREIQIQEAVCLILGKMLRYAGMGWIIMAIT